MVSVSTVCTALGAAESCVSPRRLRTSDGTGGAADLQRFTAGFGWAIPSRLRISGATDEAAEAAGRFMLALAVAFEACEALVLAGSLPGEVTTLLLLRVVRASEGS